ncbi:MAG: hypothetical protein E3K37_14255 [Candidatus Kuenenia sp.]|nr:hypothetical protein [Candidatus Kuenenia hertensis]
MVISPERLRMLEIIMKLSIDNASRALSKTLRTGAKIGLSKIYMADFNATTEKMNNDTREMTGIIVNFKGNLGCKMLFMLPLEGSIILTDYYLRQPVGTTKEFNDDTESVAQELGNILASHISNTLVSDFNAKLLPEPPQVHNDFAGIIFSSLVLEQGILCDQLLLIESIFEICKTEISCYLFLLPELASLEKLLDAIGVQK